MGKYLLRIKYNGKNYKGWQIQPQVTESKTIQGVLEEKLSIILKEKAVLFVAGRTDAGVHANDQCAHFLTNREIVSYKFLYSLNSLLKTEEISVISVEKIEDENFHARFSCRQKTYKFQIFHSRIPDVFLRDFSWQVPLFDQIKAKKTAQFLLGNHDFSSFRDSHCQAKNPIRSIENFHFEQDGNLHKIYITARSFLHHQIRIMVGTIQQIIARNQPPETILEILEKKDRKIAGPTAPASGLFLEKIEY